MTGFQRLCLVTCVVIFGLIVIGGVVRATDSGLGCPDWPTCHGHVIPKADKATLIEYTHRLTASVAGFLVLAITIVSFRSFRRVPAVLYPAAATLVLIIFQASLGGVAVINELPPEVVTVHLGTALVILSVLSLITITTFALRQPLAAMSTSRNFKRLAVLGLAGTFLLMLIGAYLAGADYGLACSGWPRCNGEIFPSSSTTSVQIHFLHRFVALLLGVVLLALLWQGWRERLEAPGAFVLAAGAFAVYFAQVMIGAVNVWTKIADEASIAHLAFGTLLWLVLSLLNIRIHALYNLLPHSSEVSMPGGLAKVSR